MKIGLFGGSFNPVHRHHVRIAEAARDACGLDEVWFIPVHQPVHKDRHDLLSYDARRSLVETAIRDLPGLRICDVERDLGGLSYTIRTVRALRDRHPANDFMLVIGADSLFDLPGWMSAEELVREIGFAVVVRPGIDADLSLPNSRSGWVPLEPDPVSSKTVRNEIARGRLRHLPVPPAVMAQIVERGYYDCWGGFFKIWHDIISARVSTLPAGLRTHVESVARLAAAYACEFGLDARLGLLGGLAHDLFRGAGAAEIYGMVDRARIRLGTLEKKVPMLAHGAAAAAFLATLEPSPPAELCRAVRWHTFPRPAHAPLTRVLIMADALDPSRGEPERDRIRNSNLSIEQRWKSVVALKRECAGRADRDKSVAQPVPASAQPSDTLAAGCAWERK
ncbi:nicotinate (nicotinamide) nucleotide adenylyltransferase [Candidatus Ozemobacteraceae bacterium]|nr:nicotinate (nicotinamide) nucleotide adenylyltransferase [Candidatus Ozemobacteraceae bacterium]